MRPADIGLLHWTQDPQLSPDAAQIAWCEVSHDIREDRLAVHLMVAPARGGQLPRRFSQGPGDFSPRWSPDGRYMAFLSASDGPPALSLAPLEGGAVERIEAPGAVSWIEWSPSGDRLALVVDVPSRSDDTPQVRNAPVVVRGLSQKLDGAGWRSGRRHVHIYDLATGRLRQLTTGDYDHASPAWSPDGDWIVFSSDRSAGRDNRLGLEDLWSIPADGGRVRRLTRGVGGADLPMFSPDGTKVAFVGAPRAAERFEADSRILVVNADGSGASSVVAPGLDRPIGVSVGPSKPYAWLGAEELIFNVVDRGSIGLSRARLGARSARPVVSGDLQVLGISVAGAGRQRSIAYDAAWVDMPSEIFVRPVAAGEPLRVSRTSEHLTASVELLPATRHSTTARDGQEIEYFLIRPSSRQGKARRAQGGGRTTRPASPPLYLEIHGGPAFYNPTTQLFAYYQVLAAAGYAVVLPNPRGSIGYGLGFRRLATGDWGGSDLVDLLACADDAIEHGFADGKRQFVGGYSYGGFMTAWLVGQTGRFRAAIVGAPIVDHVSMFGTTDVPSFLAASLQGDPWSDPEGLRYRSPLTHAPEVTTPVLLHVNEGDLRCPAGQADQFYSALKWLGKSVDYLRYPGGSHLAYFPTAGTPSQSRDRAARFLDFLSSHGGTRAR